MSRTQRDNPILRKKVLFFILYDFGGVADNVQKKQVDQKLTYAQIHVSTADVKYAMLRPLLHESL